MDSIEYDAIVVGSGISGGWAAKELCEQGLKTLLLERGRNVEHLKDYPTMSTARWQFPLRGDLPLQWRQDNPLISRAAGYDAGTAHFFVKDADHPYIQEQPFNWVRGYQVGGKSLIWGRACARWAPTDFTAPRRYGYGIPWPINYEDIAPWYSHVEKFIGVSGSPEGIETMPDGEYLPPYELNCVEQHLRTVVEGQFGRHYVSGRWAHLTAPQPIHAQQGRGSCMNRNLCMRGCPYGGYFSTNSSTLPWAVRTGNLTLRPHSVVRGIEYDEKLGRATAVKVIDGETRQELSFRGKVIFVAASALNTNLILLNSRSRRFPDGLGNDSGLLGTHIGFHNYRAAVSGHLEGFQDRYYEVAKPAECIIPAFRNVHRQDTEFLGSYVIFSSAFREALNEDGGSGGETIGAGFKRAISRPSRWFAYMYMQGETLPKRSNHVRLSPDRTDAWGIPQLIISVGYDDNDDRMVQDFLKEGRAMLEAAGVKDVQTKDSHQPPGLDIHEMGGVRMGTDPRTSLLNAHNQLHHCRNVFVTDGACMTSTGSQSPSILYMALSARAARFAAGELKRHGTVG
jgi:choline dehydrogenase-like flavoprotein